MKELFTIKVYADDMGTFTQPGCNSLEDALWHINSARGHDGLNPITIEGLRKWISGNSAFGRATIERNEN